MKILITGATGLIGQEIVRLCHLRNIEVNYLTTNKLKLERKKNYKGFYWNPYKHEIDILCFKDVAAIIHLAGASVAKRWTESYKQEIINSRVEVSQFLFDSLKNEKHTIKQVISASAIGIYQDSLTKYYNETETQFDNSFLSSVVQHWEDAVEDFNSLGINVAKVRIGLVLSNKGGALPPMIKPIKLGIGSVLGTGNQWQSWIHIDDLVNIFLYILENQLKGIYNAVAPNPVTNSEFTKAMASVLHKPLWLPSIPKNAMKLILGEMHALLFLSQRVSSKKIENLGFQFKYFHLQKALEDILKN